MYTKRLQASPKSGEIIGGGGRAPGARASSWRYFAAECVCFKLLDVVTFVTAFAVTDHWTSFKVKKLFLTRSSIQADIYKVNFSD